MYLFGSIDGKEPEILGIIINCYAYNENDIDFQVEVIKENEVKLISCQVEYTNIWLKLQVTIQKILYYNQDQNIIWMIKDDSLFI